MKRVSRQCVHSLEGTLTEQGTVLGHTCGYGRFITSKDSDVISQTPGEALLLEPIASGLH